MQVHNKRYWLACQNHFFGFHAICYWTFGYAPDKKLFLVNIDHEVP